MEKEAELSFSNQLKLINENKNLKARILSLEKARAKDKEKFTQRIGLLEKNLSKFSIDLISKIKSEIELNDSKISKIIGETRETL